MTAENQLRQAEAVANREPEDADECRHDWYPVSRKRGVTLWRCERCGKRDEEPD